MNIGKKQSFDIGGCLGLSRGKRIVAVKVMQIALSIYLAASGAAIAKPSEIETPAAVPGHEWSEIGNSDLKRLELGAKVSVNVVGPSGNVRVEGTKLSQDGGAESSASSSAASLKVVAPKEMSANRSSKQNGSNSPEVRNNVVYQIIQGALLAIFVAWPIIFLGDAGPYGGMKPNEQMLCGTTQSRLLELKKRISNFVAKEN